MANNIPCNNQPIKYVNCCDVMSCMNIKSTDNSVTVETNNCGVDVKFSGNNLDNVLKINNGTCIQMVKEFVDGKLVITPVVDWACVADKICGLCPPPEIPPPPPPPPAVCPAPLQLAVVVVQ